MDTPKEYMHLELKDMPRLPVPLLNDTLRRYEEIVDCLGSREEMKKTLQAIDEFREGEGQSLQKELLDLDKNIETSYLEGFWNTMYLELRWPLPRVNPYGLLPDDKARNTGLLRAARIAVLTTRFSQKILNDEVQRPTEGKDRIPLCMSQFQWLFHCRIPQLGRDTLKRTGQSRHLVAIHNGSFYKVPLYKRDGAILSEAEFYIEFESILNDNDKGEGLGIMTTQHRDTWANTRTKITSFSQLNQDSMNAIDDALIVFSFEPQELNSFRKKHISMAHGGKYASNRWFDKLQLIFGQDGVALVSFEHSSIDATCIGVYIKELKNDIKSQPPKVHPSYVPQSHKLMWEFNDSMLKDFKNARSVFSDYTSKLSIHHMFLNEFGTTEMKDLLKISPDSFMQMAFQLTYYRLHGKPGSTYESTATTQFYHGRTECMRSVSHESIAFCKIFSNPCTSIEDKDAVLRKACKKHVQRVKLAKQGCLVDRHMYALEWLAKHRSQKFPTYNHPSIFLDPLWIRMRTDLMSTSTFPGIVGFHPSTEKGFGISYMPEGNRVTVLVSNYQGNAKLYCKVLRRTILEMRAVLSHEMKAKI